MDEIADLPELERPAETVYYGEREGEIVDAYIDEIGELQKKYFPQVYVSEPGTTKSFRCFRVGS
ncbi:hypothetical protein Harman_29830 [Haloarcula mannanilytica]|uniref:Uncharacterized protein n=1 Tax=Haloarcula mannanilytica TaxID=2509225 RepID=A0A4C2EKI9_9EURY|nr:hypothetical protein [Haloarcula mannanilytica]GCF15048.1 hypothetical protein Harman_29830 [Haloarcula mannanilytica]